MILAEYELANMIDAWEPPSSPRCSNCLNAKVMGSPADPQVYCDRGHGHVQPLPKLIRRKRPYGFARAETCPDFSDMGPPCNTGERARARRSVALRSGG